MPCSKCRRSGHNSSTCNQNSFLLSSKTVNVPISISCPLCKSAGYLPMPPHGMYPCLKCDAKGYIFVQTTNY